MFFDNAYGLLRVVVVGVLAYAGLVAMLRISGKRTLAKMNAFDFVVTVALGSTLASVLLTETVALAEGILGFALLIGLQYLVSWSAVRWKPVSRVVKAEPRLLVFRGSMLHDALRQERVTESEVLAAVRGVGLASLDDVEAVVLDTAGDMAVIRQGDPGAAAPGLKDVNGWQERVAAGGHGASTESSN
jgi:uncharacterized membrane protein YcaP (DUF421 family)